MKRAGKDSHASCCDVIRNREEEVRAVGKNVECDRRRISACKSCHDRIKIALHAMALAIICFYRFENARSLVWFDNDEDWWIFWEEGCVESNNGCSKRANTYAKYLGCPLVLCNKTRARANVVESMQIIGDVKGKNVVIIDDMVDTAGTITKAADIMKEAGAVSVRACASHCVMSGPASERIQKSALEEMVFTDSIPYSNRCAKVKQLSVADMFAETIRRVVNNESISSQYLV